MPGPSNQSHKKKRAKRKAQTAPAPVPTRMFITDTLPCLYIPDDSAPNRRVEQRTIVFPPNSTFDPVICRLLQCMHTVSEIIYAEHLSNLYEGRHMPTCGRELVMYEAYMDDNGNTTRPHNTRAAQMLLRPKSHGPMIIFKVACVLDRNGEVVPVRFEALPAHELESAEFRAKQTHYNEKKAVYKKAAMADFWLGGGIVIFL